MENEGTATIVLPYYLTFDILMERSILCFPMPLPLLKTANVTQSVLVGINGKKAVSVNTGIQSSALSDAVLNIGVVDKNSYNDTVCTNLFDVLLTN